MAQPVWVLSVDLQTKTATFQSGMADAAKSARSAFTEIKSGADGMGRETAGSMMEARHGVMLLSEEFGVHLPRSLTMFIASIGPVGAAMEAAFPFLAIAVGATLLIEALVKVHEAGEKLTDDQIKLGTAIQNAFNQLDAKILQAGIRADELRNDHLGALAKQLQLIDRQSMEELVHSFEEVAKATDVVFGDLKAQWYQFGTGSAGAKHALEEFQSEYDSLLAKGKDKEASDLLGGTLKSAEAILDAQKKMQAGYTPSADHKGDEAKYNAAAAAHIKLQEAGVGWTEKEIQAQQALVDALQAQVGIEGKIADLKKLDSANAQRTTAGAIAGEQSAAARQAAESQLRIGEQAISADRAAATARLDIQRASIAERTANDIGFADREYALQIAANAQQIAALDKLAKDYPNALRALQDKALELTADHDAKVAEITSHSQTELNAKALTDLEQSEREKIDATEKGTAARLAAIDSAIKEEQARNMQDLAAYRELLNQRVQTLQQMTEEENKLRAEAGKEAAENDQKMAELALAAQRSQQALADSTHRMTDQQRLAEAIQVANEEYAIKMQAFQKEIAALDKNGKEYQNQLQALTDKEKQLTQQHENEITAIKEKAEIERNQRILSAEQHFNDTIAAGLAQVIMGHKSFAQMMDSIGNQVVSGMIENAIKSILANDMTKESDAAAAARKAYLAGMKFPWPVNVVMGPVLGAAAFAAVMAYEGGTDRVPGVGNGDVVPAMLTPGEGVVPGGVMDKLRTMAANGDMGGGTHYRITHRPVYHVQTIDGDGIRDVLTKHSDEFANHLHGELRKMNR